MPVVGVLVVAILLGAVGFVLGGVIGAIVACYFHYRTRSEYQTRPPEETFTSGCGVLVFGFLLGSIPGIGAALGFGYLAAAGFFG